MSSPIVLSAVEQQNWDGLVLEQGQEPLQPMGRRWFQSEVLAPKWSRWAGGAKSTLGLQQVGPLLSGRWRENPRLIKGGRSKQRRQSRQAPGLARGGKVVVRPPQSPLQSMQ